MEDPVSQPTSHLEPQIVNRLVSLPLVHSTCDRMAELYQQTKETNKLIRYTLETSERCLKIMAATAGPYVQRPISALDNIACDGLDMLQERYPLIKAPSPQVYQNTVKPAVDYSMDTIDVATEQVNYVKRSGTQHIQAANEAVLKARDYTMSQIYSARDHGIEQVETIYSYTTEKWEGIKEYGYYVGTDKVNEALDTPYGALLSGQLDYSIAWSEKFIEQYLPEVEDLGEYMDDSTDDINHSQLERALTLTNKTKQRLCQHVLINLKLMKVRTQEAVDKLNFTNDLINYAKTNLAILSSMLSLKLSTIWRELNQNEEEVAAQKLDQANSRGDSGIEERLVATARHVMHMCKRGVAAVSHGFVVVPTYLADQFEKIKAYTNDLQELVNVAGGLSEIRLFIMEQTTGRITSYQDNQVFQTARNMVQVCIDNATHLQEKFTDTKDYLINTPFMNWVGLNSKESVDQEDLEMESITSSSHIKND